MFLVLLIVVAGAEFLAVACRAADVSRSSAARSQLPSPGSIEGRVFNATTGANLERARVTVDGTQLETFTDAEGRFRLTNVPAGTAQVRKRKAK